MNSLRHRAPTVALVLALLLGFSALLPFWTGSEARAAVPAGAEHAAMHHHSSADTGSTEPSSSGTCLQHDACSGQCCAGCALCVTTLPETRAFSLLSSSDLRAAVPGFRPGGSASFLERPPRG